MLFYLLIIIIIIIVFLFSSKTLSPIPYFPSQSVDIPKIIKVLNLKNNQIVFDLGAGDGIVIFEAAKSSYRQKLNAKFIAVEINPVLILILHLRRLLHPNRKNIRIVYGDIFKIDFDVIAKNIIRRGSSLDSPLQGNDIVIYVYISPWFIDKTLNNIRSQISKFSVVSYMYPLKDKTAFTKVTAVKGKNSIFVYDF